MLNSELLTQCQKIGKFHFELLTRNGKIFNFTQWLHFFCRQVTNSKLKNKIFDFELLK